MLRVSTAALLLLLLQVAVASETGCKQKGGLCTGGKPCCGKLKCERKGFWEWRCTKKCVPRGAQCGCKNCYKDKRCCGAAQCLKVKGQGGKKYCIRSGGALLMGHAQNASAANATLTTEDSAAVAAEIANANATLLP